MGTEPITRLLKRNAAEDERPGLEGEGLAPCLPLLAYNLDGLKLLESLLRDVYDWGKRPNTVGGQ